MPVCTDGHFVAIVVFQAASVSGKSRLADRLPFVFFLFMPILKFKNEPGLLV